MDADVAKPLEPTGEQLERLGPDQERHSTPVDPNEAQLRRLSVESATAESLDPTQGQFERAGHEQSASSPLEPNEEQLRRLGAGEAQAETE